MKTALTSYEDRKVEMMRKFQMGREYIKDAANDYVELLKENQKIKQELMTEYRVSSYFLDFFERLGKGLIREELYLTPFQNRILSITEQEKIINESVDCVILNPDDPTGEPDIIKVNLLESNLKVRSQIIPRNKILSIAEQRANLLAEQNLINSNLKPEECPYKIIGTELKIFKPIILHRKDLKNILMAMEK